MIIGTLLFPVWETIVSSWTKDIRSVITATEVFARVIVILFVISLLYILSLPLNHLLSFRERKIDNIIFLTKYIMEEI